MSNDKPDVQEWAESQIDTFTQLQYELEWMLATYRWIAQNDVDGAEADSQLQHVVDVLNDEFDELAIDTL